MLMNFKMTFKVGLKFGSSTFFLYLCIVKQKSQLGNRKPYRVETNKNIIYYGKENNERCNR